jgi:hypothetical protein
MNEVQNLVFHNLIIPVRSTPWAKNNFGSRWNASHESLGVKLEFFQQQFTAPSIAFGSEKRI